MVVAAGVGFALAVINPGTARIVLMALVPVFYLGLLPIFLFATARYHVPLLPLLSAGAGYGLTMVIAQDRQSAQPAANHVNRTARGAR